MYCLCGHADGRKTCIDKGWSYCYGEHPEAYAEGYDDSSWSVIDLPHDWSVENDAANTVGDNIGPFTPKSTGGSSTGFTIGGEGWYRKTFTLDKADADKKLMLYFEGAYNQATVWINGKEAHFNHYGYQSFRFDISDYCKPAGQVNTIAVKVTNIGQNTRWYAGSGIYRHVWLMKVNKLHLDSWKTQVTSDIESASEATTTVKTTLFNAASKNAKASLSIKLYAPDGSLAATGQIKSTVAKDSQKEVMMSFKLDNPSLWSPESPSLYNAVITLSDGKGKVQDEVVTSFGVRSTSFSAKDGFLLNGKKTLLYGGCIHHDNGLLGAAAFDAAENRKLTLLKNEGFNAVRTAHNITSEHFLHACDSIGLMVIEESFDQWLVAKNKNDYHQYFKEHSKSDIQTMVARDRNHPSIIMWGLGNEIPGRITPEGQAAAADLRSAILELDTTRALTAAIPEWDDFKHNWQDDSDNAFKSLDVGGYNYMYYRYENDHQRYPDRVMVGLETYPKRAAENWVLAEKYPYVIGDFVWTAMDYLGEAGIGSASFRKSGNQPFSPGWPWFNGWCGDIDLIGTKKPQSYYRDIVWHRKAITIGVEEPAPDSTHMSISAWGWQLEHQSWTLDCEEGTEVNVNVYSRSPKVRLYLNDKLIGTKETSATFWAGFKVPYTAGTLRAVTYDGEKEGDEFVLKTTGKPVALRLTADRTDIKADGSDLSYVTVELIDADGQVVPDSDTKVHFKLSGEGSIFACGNACPNDMESFRNESPKLYEGRAQAIIKSTDKAGKATVSVSTEGLPEVQTYVTTH